MDNTKIIITGGLGFIGSALTRFLFANTNSSLLVIDKMTYASDINGIKNIIQSPRVSYKKVSIGDTKRIEKILHLFQPNFIFNLAAETHVDKSILNPNVFIETNVSETHNFLVSTLNFYNSLNQVHKNIFKIIHISTDEVFGDIPLNSLPVDESYQYKPSSPYSASKAASDHLFKAYFKTFNLPVIVTNCTNNYGPYQNEEKFIPVIIKNVINKNKIPLYGNGLQSRDWLYVDDHCKALYAILCNGKVGESYNIGSDREITNIDLIKIILNLLYAKQVIKNPNLENNIIQIKDRLGHDKRYALNSSKLRNNLDWKPLTTFEIGINKTIEFYLKYLK